MADARGTQTVLVVDDEKLVRDFCAVTLKKAGYNVLSAEDGYLALQMYKSSHSPVSLALLDVRMPKMSGPELLVEMLDSQPPPDHDIRFILMSGYTDPGMLGEAHDDGRRYSFLKKPFTSSTLLEAVRRKLDCS